MSNSQLSDDPKNNVQPLPFSEIISLAYPPTESMLVFIHFYHYHLHRLTDYPRVSIDDTNCRIRMAQHKSDEVMIETYGRHVGRVDKFHSEALDRT